MSVWATPLVTFLAAVLGAWVATRNARKTPHENLKTLTDIRASLGGELSLVDPEGALGDAIRLEVTKLNELTIARGRGLWPYVKAVVRQRMTMYLSIWAVFLIVVALALFATGSWIGANQLCYPVDNHVDTSGWFWAAGTVLFVLVVLTPAAFVLAKFLPMTPLFASRRKQKPKLL
jgi:hypothetical protein